MASHEEEEVGADDGRRSPMREQRQNILTASIKLPPEDRYPFPYQLRRWLSTWRILDKPALMYSDHRLIRDLPLA
eukprot:IDg1196t1